MIRIVAFVIIFAGCLQTVSFGDNPLAGLTALSISPTDTTVEITDLAQDPIRIDYVAIGTFVDGTSRDVTEHVGWGVDNPAPGSFTAAGRYVTSQRAAGHVTVRAVAKDIEATARVTVIVTVTIVDDQYPPPVGAEALFADEFPVVTDDALHSPTLLYPARETKFPQGLARILFQISPGRNNDAFRLRFDSDVLHLTVLTGSERWQPDSAIWQLIEESHPGAAATLTIDAATTAAPGTIYASAAIPLSFSRTAPGGVLYYFSGATSGVMRTVPSATTATKLFPSATDTTCASCHAVSRSGSTMALGYGGERLQQLRLPDAFGIQNASTARPMGWSTFSPAGDLMLVADKGALTLVDAVSGQPVGPNGGRVPLGALKATHPDWSPDGRYLAVAVSGDITNMEIKLGSIARIPYNDGAWGPPEVLVASTADNNYFPRWSPDGNYIAYVHANEPSHGAVSAELRLIHGDGGAPILLRLASHRVGMTDDIAGLADTMPVWAPALDDVAWLAFASIRPYGAVRPLTGPSQVWIAAIDLSLVGQDPSYPALWLPSQDIRALANNPVWSVEPVQTE